MSRYSADWAKVDVDKVPNIKVTPPGPKSRAIQKRADKYMQGYSSQVSLFKVAFESGHGVTLKDVDGNEYIDFSSGIYVTNFGHCHPKITEAMVKYTRRLQNCHDFNTEIKTKYDDKIRPFLPGTFTDIKVKSGLHDQTVNRILKRIAYLGPHGDWLLND